MKDHDSQMKSFTAEDARFIAKQARQINMDPIYAQVKRAAESGDNIVSIGLSAKSGKFVNEIIAELKLKGFSARRDQFDDCRDSWDNLVIEW